MARPLALVLAAPAFAGGSAPAAADAAKRQPKTTDVLRLTR